MVLAIVKFSAALAQLDDASIRQLDTVIRQTQQKAWKIPPGCPDLALWTGEDHGSPKLQSNHHQRKDLTHSSNWKIQKLYSYCLEHDGQKLTYYRAHLRRWDSTDYPTFAMGIPSFCQRPSPEKLDCVPASFGQGGRKPRIVNQMGRYDTPNAS